VGGYPDPEPGGIGGPSEPDPLCGWEPEPEPGGIGGDVHGCGVGGGGAWHCGTPVSGFGPHHEHACESPAQSELSSHVNVGHVLCCSPRRVLPRSVCSIGAKMCRAGARRAVIGGPPPPLTSMDSLKHAPQRFVSATVWLNPSCVVHRVSPLLLACVFAITQRSVE